MVTVTQRPSAAAAAAHSALELALAGLDADERVLVERAAAFAAPLYDGKLLGTGETALDHAYGLAGNLAQLRVDAATRAAGLLFAAPEYLPNADRELAARIDPAVAALVSGVAKLNRMRVVTRGLAATAEKGKQSQAEILRKMLLGMVEDIRVVLIRLASRTQTLRFLARAPDEARREVARETLDIYAPLANRLGVWQLKWELEDLSFRYLEPELYKRIAGQLDERRGERESFIDEARAALSRAVAAAGIAAEVTGRPKHIYSIYSKMRQKGVEFEALRDVRGLRVLVDAVRDCYAVLGIVHDLWQPIPEAFDDYIARPKDNDYRSLHTAVVGADGRALEVQIRTHEMHRHAELGVAAHWRYKEGRARGEAFDDKIAWLRQVLAWRDEIVDAAEWVEQSKRAALDETVYALTPQGRVIDLPRGATPIDFAYALHTDLGHRCRGAKVDGAMVPLDTKLANGQRVEIVAAKAGGPSRDWLNPQRGYLASSRARHKVRQWFNSEELARTIAAGRAAVERELAREGATGVKLETLAERLGFAGTDDFFAAVGREEVGPRALQAALQGPVPAPPPAAETLVAKKSRAEAGGTGVLFVGVDRLLTQLARCCKPVPPDAIAGFVTRGRGISVHRRDCRNLAHLLARYPERGIEAQWGERAASVFPVDIAVQAHDRQGLLRDVSEVLSRERLNVTGVSTQSRRDVATMFFTVEAEDLDHLRRALAQIADVPGVFAAARR